jgi:hypothetical protein
LEFAMKILISVVLAGACTQPVLGCDLCSVYAATEAQGGSGKGFFGGVAEQFTHFGTVQEDGHKVASEGQYIDSSVAQVFAGYNFNNNVGVQLNLPVIYRAFGSETIHGTELGIGDVSLVGTFTPYRHLSERFNFSWTLLGGVKFPTGDSSRLNTPDSELPEGIGGHDLALGSGSYDGLVGTGASGRWKRLFASASLQYAIRSEGDFQHQYANDLTWFGGPGVYLVLGHQYTLSLQAVVSGETKGKDTFSGVPDGDSAETLVYLGPQVNLTWGSRLAVVAGVDLPVSRDNSGLQVLPDYRVRGAVTLRF